MGVRVKDARELSRPSAEIALRLHLFGRLISILEIVPAEGGEPIVRKSAGEAMAALYERMLSVQTNMAAAGAQFPHAAGYFFGYLHEPVQRALHGGDLGGADAEEEPPAALPVSRSGCARTEGHKWKGLAPRSLEGAEDGAVKKAKRKRDADDDDVADDMSNARKKEGIVEKIKGLNAAARSRFKVARSKIHGWGLFVKTPIAKGEMCIEYQGWLIRSSMNEVMLKKYTRDNVFGATDGSYIFRVDQDYQVDATMAGNIARFMNHSCAPNLVSKIVELSGKSNSLDKKIVFYAKRDMRVGEELSFDYQFALGGEKIECHCGAPECWGRMN